MTDILLVSLGAVFGANARFFFYKKLEKYYIKKDFIILIINILSSFSLGFLISFISKFGSLNISLQLSLFFSIGFFASLSTFSTYIYDLFELFKKKKFTRAINLLFISMVVGIIAFAFGFLLGNH